MCGLILKYRYVGYLILNFFFLWIWEQTYSFWTVFDFVRGIPSGPSLQAQTLSERHLQLRWSGNNLFPTVSCLHFIAYVLAVRFPVLWVNFLNCFWVQSDISIDVLPCTYFILRTSSAHTHTHTHTTEIKCSQLYAVIFFSTLFCDMMPLLRISLGHWRTRTKTHHLPLDLILYFDQVKHFVRAVFERYFINKMYSLKWKKNKKTRPK